MTLTSQDFVAFHRSVHGYDPFPWQRTLMDFVLHERSFPDLIDVPTGAGKTTLLDIAIFALAADESRPETERWMPRRTVLVVDRRLIVDQAGERARKLATAIDGAQDEITGELKRRLSNLSSHGVPVATAVLRGGTVRDDAWAHHPDQPLLAASTVDQVGSRLLFRGYGVRPRAAPIHAGILGRDTLYLLDEVHLSKPFHDTLKALHRYGSGWAEVEVGRPIRIVQLSATPGEDETTEDPETAIDNLAGESERTPSRQRFRIGDEDREHPVLRTRLGARKPVTMELVSSGSDAAFTKTVSDRARRLVKAHKAVGVVVNRVATALAVHQACLSAVKDDAYDVRLITGRMRALDREELLQELIPRICAGRERSEQDKPLIVVATQCIEAGADFDFDALVTECASLDALRQRFGRLDRLGEYTEAHGHAPGFVVALNKQVSGKREPDPIYGTALYDTWGWLQEVDAAAKAASAPDPSDAADDAEFAADDQPARAVPDAALVGLDMGIEQIQPWVDQLAKTRPADVPEGEGTYLSDLLAPQERAPLLFPAFLDIWCQTAPMPAFDPPVASWLHGPDDRAEDVQIVWRADLTEDELSEVAPDDQNRGGPPPKAKREVLRNLLDRLQFVPPTSPETLSVPVGAVRRWLTADPRDHAKQSAYEVGDVEGALESEFDDRERGRRFDRPFVVWQGNESKVATSRGGLKPGATIVVPASYGGISASCWDPSSTEPVRDRGELALLVAHGRMALRLDPIVLDSVMREGAQPSADAARPAHPGLQLPTDESVDTHEATLNWLKAHLSGASGAPVWLRGIASRLSELLEGVVAKRSHGRVDLTTLHRLKTADEQKPNTARKWVWVGVSAPARLTRDEIAAVRGVAANLQGEPTSEFEGAGESAFIAREIRLHEHLNGVAKIAALYAKNLGVGEKIANDILLAAGLHDVGKCDPRFQTWLHGGDPIRAMRDAEPLAKSALPQEREADRRTARIRAGYPAGHRHEMTSAAMLQASAPWTELADDLDLVLHLITSHHGHARPFAPPIADAEGATVRWQPSEDQGVAWWRKLPKYTYGPPAPLEISGDATLARLDSGVGDRFWRMVRRYGWHGLAWMEAIVRLADHRRSAQEERGDTDPHDTERATGRDRDRNERASAATEVAS